MLNLIFVKGCGNAMNAERDFGCRGSRYRFCRSASQSDICRFRYVTLLPLHLVVNWQVLPLIIHTHHGKIWHGKVHRRIPITWEIWHWLALEPTKFIFLSKLWYFQGKGINRSWRNLAWCKCRLGSALACQIWPWSITGVGARAPPQILTFVDQVISTRLLIYFRKSLDSKCGEVRQ